MDMKIGDQCQREKQQQQSQQHRPKPSRRTYSQALASHVVVIWPLESSFTLPMALEDLCCLPQRTVGETEWYTEYDSIF